MVYESGFTTRRTYSSRPVVSSYAVSNKSTIDWDKFPYIPRPTLIADPVTAFGVRRPDLEYRKSSILYPINRIAIKPSYRVFHAPIDQYVATRDKNRNRILTMVRQHIDTIEAGGNTAACTSRDSLDTVLPRLHRAASVNSYTPVKRETYRDERSGAMYPVVEKVSRVYKTSFPIYSSYTSPRRVFSGTRVISSPIRIITSPTRIVSRVIRSPSPVRVVRTTTRVVSSPERTTSYSYSTPSTYYGSPYIPSTYNTNYIPPTYVYSTPSYVSSYAYSPISRVYTQSLFPDRIATSPLRSTPSYLKRIPPGYGARALTNYLSTEPFATFREETNRIRNRAQSLIRDLHTPVVRRARSCTPFPVTGYTYEPASQLALDAYVARITNPVRHVAKEVHNMSHYPEPAHKYVGKSHLASVRICGDRAYNIRKPMYDSDKVRTDINLLSWYLRHPERKCEKKKCADNVEKVQRVENKEEEVHDLDPHRPTRKFSAPKSLDDPIDEETKEKQRLRKERLMTVNEEDLDQVELEKKKAKLLDEAKLREKRAIEEEKKMKAEAKDKKKEEGARLAEQALKAEEQRRKTKEDKKTEEARLAEEAKLAEESRLAEEVRLLEEAKLAEKARLAEKAKLAEEARLVEETRLAEEALKAEEQARKQKEDKEAEEARFAEEAKLAEEARLAEEVRLSEEAKLAEEDRLAEEAKQAEEATRKDEQARLEEEQRLREEELNRLAELEKQAEEDCENEIARQAAELAEIARQEAVIVAQELQAIQQVDKEPVLELEIINDPEVVVEEPDSPLEDSKLEPNITLSAAVDEVTSENGDISVADEETYYN